jgi:hypothetical protein
MRELMSSCELEPLPVNSMEVDSMFFTFSDPAEKTYRPSPSPSFDDQAGLYKLSSVDPMLQCAALFQPLNLERDILV